MSRRDGRREDILRFMRESIFIRPLSDAGGEALMVEGLRSRDAFVPHRCQILLANSDGEPLIRSPEHSAARTMSTCPSSKMPPDHTLGPLGQSLHVRFFDKRNRRNVRCEVT